MNRKMKGMLLLLALTTAGTSGCNKVSNTPFKAQNTDLIASVQTEDLKIKSRIENYSNPAELTEEINRLQKLAEYLNKTGRGRSVVAQKVNEQLLNKKLLVFEQRLKSITENIGGNNSYKIENYNNDSKINTVYYNCRTNKGFTNSVVNSEDKLLKTDELPEVLNILMQVTNANLSEILKQNNMTVKNIDLNVYGKFNFIDLEINTNEGKELISYTYAQLQEDKIMARYEFDGRCYTYIITQVPESVFEDVFRQWHTPNGTPVDYDLIPWQNSFSVGKHTEVKTTDVLPEDYFNLP